MARGDRLNQALRNRILTSTHSLTVHYPAVRVPATGTAPGPAPLRPLTGVPPAATLVPVSTPTPSQPPVTMPCLWTDAFHSVKTRTNVAMAGGARQFGRVGWVEGAEALARVLLEDAIVDPTDPAGTSLFARIAYVEYQGHRYHVLGHDRLGNSFRDPVSYYVWLIGAEGQ